MKHKKLLLLVILLSRCCRLAWQRTMSGDVEEERRKLT